MLFEKIRSLYILKDIFSFIKDKWNLNLIKYNKRLQNKIDITILHYKILSGKYIEYEPNGKGKEYNAYNDQILYEGEFSKGKRNGKGKEYNEKGIFIFEGEYLNGEKIGKSKEYDDGKLIFEFEGEYLNEIIWNGIGKEYDINGKLRFEYKYKYSFGRENGRKKNLIIKIS